MFKKGMQFFLIVLSFLLFSSSNLAALESQANLPKITVIKDIEITIFQGSIFKLPTTVSAVLNDNKATTVSIKWDKTSPKTTKPGIYTFNGTVKDYPKKVILTLKILPPISSINDINAAILCNSQYTLPASIPATLTDKSSTLVQVSWKKTNIDYNKVGRYTFEGTVAGYKNPIKLYLDVKSIYKSVSNINDTIKHNQPYSLPQKVKATLVDGTIIDVPITWSKSSIDTTVVGKSVVEGIVAGYPEKVSLSYQIIPTIASIADKSLLITKGDIYSLPKTVDAAMSDGSVQKVEISWTPNVLDLTKIGISEIIGKVASYEKDIKWSFHIRTDFNVMSQVVNYTKWGYIPITFSKNLVASTKLDNVILKDEDEIQIKITQVIPGITAKDCLLIIPARSLDKNKTYTLTILKNTVQAENGDYYPEDISFTFTNNI